MLCDAIYGHAGIFRLTAILAALTLFVYCYYHLFLRRKLSNKYRGENYWKGYGLPPFIYIYILYLYALGTMFYELLPQKPKPGLDQFAIIIPVVGLGWLLKRGVERKYLPLWIFPYILGLLLIMIYAILGVCPESDIVISGWAISLVLMSGGYRWRQLYEKEHGKTSS